MSRRAQRPHIMRSSFHSAPLRRLTSTSYFAHEMPSRSLIMRPINGPHTALISAPIPGAIAERRAAAAVTWDSTVEVSSCARNGSASALMRRHIRNR